MTYRAIEKLVKAGIQFSETNPPHDKGRFITLKRSSGKSKRYYI